MSSISVDTSSMKLLWCVLHPKHKKTGHKQEKESPWWLEINSQVTICCETYLFDAYKQKRMTSKQSNHLWVQMKIRMTKQLDNSKQRDYKIQIKILNQHPKLTNFTTKLSCKSQIIWEKTKRSMLLCTNINRLPDQTKCINKEEQKINPTHQISNM